MQEACFSQAFKNDDYNPDKIETETSLFKIRKVKDEPIELKIAQLLMPIKTTRRYRHKNNRKSKTVCYTAPSLEKHNE